MNRTPSLINVHTRCTLTGICSRRVQVMSTSCARYCAGHCARRVQVTVHVNRTVFNRTGLDRTVGNRTVSKDVGRGRSLYGWEGFTESTNQLRIRPETQ